MLWPWTSQKILIGCGQLSSVFLINSGVPQGSILGPTLFLLFINDLPDALQSQIALYADDSTIFYASLGRVDGMHLILNSALCLTGTSHRFWLGVKIGLSPLMTARAM